MGPTPQAAPPEPISDLARQRALLRRGLSARWRFKFAFLVALGLPPYVAQVRDIPTVFALTVATFAIVGAASALRPRPAPTRMVGRALFWGLVGVPAGVVAPLAAFLAEVAVALVVTALVLVVMILVYGWMQRSKARRAAPRQGELWWALVPYLDGETDDEGRNAKVRPVYVLTVWPDATYTVCPITSQEKRRAQRGYLELPVRLSRGRTSFVRTTDPVRLPLREFDRLVGVTLPSDVRETIERQANLGDATVA